MPHDHKRQQSIDRASGDPIAELRILFRSLYESDEAKAQDDFFRRLQEAMWPGRVVDIARHRPKDDAGQAGWRNDLDRMLFAGGVRGEAADAVAAILRGTVVQDAIGKLAFLRHAKKLCRPTSQERQQAATYRRIARRDDLLRLRQRAREHRDLLRLIEEIAARRHEQATEQGGRARRMAAGARTAPAMATAKRSEARRLRGAAKQHLARRNVDAADLTDCRRRVGRLVDAMQRIAGFRSKEADRAAYATAEEHGHRQAVHGRMDARASEMIREIADDRAAVAAKAKAASLASMQAIITQAATMEPEAAAALKRTTIDQNARNRQVAADRTAIAGAIGYLMRARDEATDPADREAIGGLIAARAAVHDRLKAAGSRAAVRSKINDAGPKAKPCRAWCEPETHGEDRRDAEHDKHLKAGDAVVDEDWKRIRDERRQEAEKLHVDFLERTLPDLDHAITRVDAHGDRVVSRHGRFADRILDVPCGHKAVLRYVSAGLPADGDPDRLAEAFAKDLPMPHLHERFLMNPKTKQSTRFLHVVQAWSSKVPDAVLTPERMLGQLFCKMHLLGLDPARHRVFVVEHQDKAHRHLHAWVDRVDAETGETWAMNSIERTMAAAMANSLMNAGFIRHTVMDRSDRDPTFHAPVYGKHLYAVGMAALASMADGKARCDLLRQDLYEDPETLSCRYEHSTSKSPLNGDKDDDSKDSRRDLYKRKLINDALRDLGVDGLNIPGGFFKIDDYGRGSLNDLTANEKTHRNTAIRDNVDHSRSWLYEAGEKRPTTMREHLARKLAAKAA